MLNKKQIASLSSHLEGSEALFFDFDGTIVNSLSVLYKVYTQFMDQLSLESSSDEFQSLNGPSMREVVAILQEKHHLDGSLDDLYSRYSSLICEAYRGEIALMPGVLQFFDLFSNKRLIIVTSSELSWVEVVLDREGILERFESIITPIDEQGKPNPAIYLRALRELELTPSQVVTVEDSESGVLASVSAGIPTVRIADEVVEMGQVATFSEWTTLTNQLKCVERCPTIKQSK